MPTKYRSQFVIAGTVLAWAAVAFFLGGRGAAKPWGSQEAPAKNNPRRLYFGAELTCSNVGCHTSHPDKKTVLVCSCTEYLTWSQEDKHSLAYRVLLGERAKNMGKALGYKVPVSEHEGCLSCHSVVIKDGKLAHKSFKREEGVTCVVCHGAYEDWYNPHSSYLQREKWRDLSREAKERQFGMTDLWTPYKRAGLCVSCHIGDFKSTEPKRFLTHQMYAAGHPPLPSFEAASFSRQMPMHWQYLRDKPEEVKKLLRYKEGELERTKLILVGAAASLRESMSLLEQQAAECVKDPKPDKRTLDWANFDCYACHHELKTPSWRQARGYLGKPGRVPMRTWPAVLIKLAIRQVANDDNEAKTMATDFEMKWRHLQTAFDDRPFGDPAKIAPAAHSLAEWADALAKRVDKKPCGEDAARRLLVHLPTLYANGTPDYDSARQIAWAFQVMYEELKPQLGDTGPQIGKLLETLGRELKLDLPSGRQRDITEELRDGLKRLNSYDPDKFREAIRTLTTLVKGK